MQFVKSLSGYIVIVMLMTISMISCGGKAESNVETASAGESVTHHSLQSIDGINENNSSYIMENEQPTAAADEMSTQSVPYVGGDNDVKVRIVTTMGEIVVELFNDTPRHRDNFVKLAKEGYYNNTLFHRVINEFMIQAGDPDSRNAPRGKMLGMGDPGYTIEAEIVYPQHFHHRGALAAARQGDATNPERRSSGSQFYIVTGKVYSAGQLGQIEKQLNMVAQQEIFNRLATEHRDTIMSLRRNRDQAGLQVLQTELIARTEAEAAANPVGLTDVQRQLYSTVGGTPHLDGQYTVFGRVIEGMEVVDAIQAVETDNNDRPNDDVRIISMQVL